MSLLRIDETSDSSIQNLAVEYGEMAVDQLIEDDLLREVPLIGTGVKVIKVIVAVKDVIFQRNLTRFRYHLGDVSEEKKRDFINKLERDDDYRQKVGENLVLLLHRIDDVRKCEVIARIFRAFLEGTLTEQQFEKLRVAVDRMRYYDLPALVDFYSDSPSEEILSNDSLRQEFLHWGLADFEFADGLTFGKAGYYKKNIIGELFVRIAQDDF